uniref:Anterior gradient 3, protein disulphide isomerase family member n=1 Tax=Gallus gallus TaxID=9031 RepID=A0A8V0XD00_CHICK
MLHSTLALSLLLIAVSSNLAMAIKKEKRAPQTLSRGWGDEITWVQTYEEGLYQAKKSNKPLMVIHHLEDCQYCQALKKAFAENEEIQEMAQDNFIMLNLMHETTDKNLSPDGQYVPRIMFIGMYSTYESSEDVISASMPVSFSRNIKTSFCKKKIAQNLSLLWQ